jgi:hypothetical protein
VRRRRRSRTGATGRAGFCRAGVVLGCREGGVYGMREQQDYHIKPQV